MTGPREHGFSLIEVLVSMTLLSLIGLLAAGAVDFGRTAWDRTEARGNALAETRAVQTFLRRQIRQIRTIRMRSGTRTPNVFFQGEAGSLAFIAPIAAHAAPVGEHLIQLGLGASGDTGDTLEIGFQRIGSRRPEPGTPGIVEPLLDGARALGLRYFGPLPSGTLAWQETWQARSALPRLIEVTVTFTDPSRSWPPLVIAIPGDPLEGSAG